MESRDNTHTRPSLHFPFNIFPLLFRITVDAIWIPNSRREKKILEERKRSNKYRNLRKSLKLNRMSNDHSVLELNNVKLKEIWKAMILHENVPCGFMEKAMLRTFRYNSRINS